MPQVGEGATHGPEALYGGGHTSYKSSVIHEFSPLDYPCDIIQLRARAVQYPPRIRPILFLTPVRAFIKIVHAVRVEPNVKISP